MGPVSWPRFSPGTVTSGSAGWAGSTRRMSYPRAGASQSTSVASKRSRRPVAASRPGVSHRISPRIWGSEEAARQSPIDGDDGAGDVARGIRGEEADDVRHLLRLAKAPQRDRLEVRRARLALVRLGKACRLDPARRNRVDGDLLRPELARDRLRPADDARTDGIREREVLDRLAHRARFDVDHAPASAALELRPAELGQADRREQEQLDRALDLVVGQPDGGRSWRPAAVV